MDYKENPDGSIDIGLVLYFNPQNYFYLGLIISATTLPGCGDVFCGIRGGCAGLIKLV